MTSLPNQEEQAVRERVRELRADAERMDRIAARELLNGYGSAARAAQVIGERLRKEASRLTDQRAEKGKT